jgi:hypothetical protein
VATEFELSSIIQNPVQIIQNPVQIIQNPALSSWNLALRLISEDKKIQCKLYKIYY